jgi:hypothetical protein
MPVKLWRAITAGAKLDVYAHIQHPHHPGTTKCYKKIDSAASIKGLELCDKCLEYAGGEK